MTEYKKYSEYKDSGVEWLGKIPADWSIRKVENVAKFSTGATPSTNKSEYFDGDIVWVNISDLNNTVISDSVKKITDAGVKSANMEVSPKGSLLFSFKLSVGKVSIAGADIYTNEAIATFKPSKKLNTKFSFYSFPLTLIKNAKKNIYNADLLNAGLIREARFPLPPLKTQQKIVEFLDKETAHIDAGIANMESLITLLTEKRAALISETVTRGIPGEHSEFKDSGVDWLGMIPAGWSARKVENVTKFLTGGTPSTNNDDYFDGDITWVNISDLDKEIVEESKKKISLAGVKNANIPISPKGSLLFSFKLSVGKVAIAGKDLYTNEAIATFAPSGRIDTKFAFYSFPVSLIKNAKKNIYDAYLLNAGLIREAKFALPPLSEQKRIVNFLDKETKQIEDALLNAKSVIKLMKEKRKVLISDAVTGKIDVSEGVN